MRNNFIPKELVIPIVTVKQNDDKSLMPGLKLDSVRPEENRIELVFEPPETSTLLDSAAKDKWPNLTEFDQRMSSEWLAELDEKITADLEKTGDADQLWHELDHLARAQSREGIRWELYKKRSWFNENKAEIYNRTDCTQVVGEINALANRQLQADEYLAMQSEFGGLHVDKSRITERAMTYAYFLMNTVIKCENEEQVMDWLYRKPDYHLVAAALIFGGEEMFESNRGKSLVKRVDITDLNMLKVKLVDGIAGWVENPELMLTRVVDTGLPAKINEGFNYWVDQEKIRWEAIEDGLSNEHSELVVSDVT